MTTGFGFIAMQSFFRAQAALCLRIARSFPQERIADELMQIAADFEAKAKDMEPEDGEASASWPTLPDSAATPEDDAA